MHVPAVVTKVEKEKREESEGTYLALYGESGTCVFASMEVSYSFALQTEAQQKAVSGSRKEKVQPRVCFFLYHGRHTIVTQLK